MIMWLIMRGAMNDRIRRVHSTYHVPASNTAAALALFDNRGPQPA
jgi:protocatechuate 4,5-dioxygenase beta chain